MTGRVIAVLAIAILAGLGAQAAWGAYVGVGVAALILVVGTVLLVLRRNQTDLEMLERGESPLDADREKDE